MLMNAMLSCRLQRDWFWTWDTSTLSWSSCPGDSRSSLQALKFWSQLCQLFCIHQQISSLMASVGHWT